MADKGLIESARRMYGAKDAARQEAKKDTLRSGEMLYRGLRDFGAMQQREKMYKESMAFREKSLQQSMEFRQEQMDWQKLKYDEMQQQREYDRIAQNSAVLQSTLGKINEDPAVLVGNSLNFYKDEISKLSDMIARREGDPKQLTEQRQKLLNELSTASGQYNTFLDGARQILGMNLSDPNALPDFDIMSNDPKSLKAKKMWTTVINGMQDGTAKFNFDGGDFTVTANFDGKGPSTVKLNESGMLDYNLKNSGKGNELFGIYGDSVNAAVTGTQANAQLLATNYAASLSYNDVVSLSRDYDPNWNGTDTSTFKYNRFIGEDGKRVEMINNTWMDAQNMWWDEIRNTMGVSGNEQEWKDNEGNTYKRSGEGADMRWTKTDANGNMSEHEWWNDKSWSGDNGTGVKLRDAFSNWLGDISADYINKTHYKSKPPTGSRFKPPADLGSTFAQVQDIIDNGQLNRLKGIKFGDQRINQIEQQEDGTFNLLFSSVMGGDYESGAIVNIDLTKKGTAKETLFNYIGDVDSGNVYTSPRYAEYNLSVDNEVVETDETSDPNKEINIEDVNDDELRADFKEINTKRQNAQGRFDLSSPDGQTWTMLNNEIKRREEVKRQEELRTTASSSPQNQKIMSEIKEEISKFENTKFDSDEDYTAAKNRLKEILNSSRFAGNKNFTEENKAIVEKLINAIN